MKKLFMLVAVFSIAFHLMAQNPNPYYDKIAIKSSTAWLDIDYVGDRVISHKLDVHLPVKGKGPFPIVICIYGSAWLSNDAKAATFSTGLGQALLEAGFGVVSINHRASWEAKFPAQIHDIKAAIRFIRANSASFNLDPSFIGVTGWSSGGHLSNLAGTTSGTKSATIEGLEIDLEGKLGKHLQESTAVDAIVDWFGPTDFLIMDECGSSFSHNDPKSPESSLIGGPIQENKDKVALANPLSYVHKNNPPFLIFHGDKDPTVPHCESVKLHEKQKKEGARTEFISVPGGQHGPGVMIDEYYQRMVAFFKGELKAKKK